MCYRAGKCDTGKSPGKRTPREGDEGLGFHHDAYTADGARVAQRAGTPVFGVSLGAAMNMEVLMRKSRRGKVGGKPQVAMTMRHGSCYAWTRRSDAACKHRPVFAEDRKAGDERIVILGRYVDRLGVYGTATEPVDMLTARQHMINVSAIE